MAAVPKRRIAARAKGLRWELAVRRAYEAAGFTVRGLEGEGDHLCLRRDGLCIASEAKNQARLKLPEWWRQTKADAPGSAVPVLTFKLGGEMLSVIATADLLRLVGEAAQTTGGTEQSSHG